MSTAATMQPPAGPPYAPTTAAIGERPTVGVDIPILAVLLVFYIAGAASNMTILQLNRRRGHKFLPSGLLSGFCMMRTLTCCLRIGLATRPQNISLSIAALIFVNAGILFVYIVNLIFAQRVLRARQPELGWHPAVRWLFKILFTLIAIALAILITFIVIGFYTLDQHLKQVSRDLQLAAITYLLIVAMAPLIILAVSFSLPPSARAETFGSGSMAGKARVLATSATLCVLGAGFKTGANWEPVRPVSDPAWYQQKPAFYVFIFVLEIFIICLLIITRVDKRFHVPDGASKRQTYVTDPENKERPGSSGTECEVDGPKEQA